MHWAAAHPWPQGSCQYSESYLDTTRRPGGWPVSCSPCPNPCSTFQRPPRLTERPVSDRSRYPFRGFPSSLRSPEMTLGRVLEERLIPGQQQDVELFAYKRWENRENPSLARLSHPAGITSSTTTTVSSVRAAKPRSEVIRQSTPSLRAQAAMIESLVRSPCRR